MGDKLFDIYTRLHAHFGPQHWWPQSTGAFEIIVGAILTQNTAWTNVEKALANLKRGELLAPVKMYRTSESRIAKLIRPSGFFRQKAKKLVMFTRWLFENHRGRLENLSRLETQKLRKELLALHGIGPETADSILLYAVHKPVFVVDAYTRRICSRVGLSHEDAPYDELQQAFMTNLPRDERLYNEYHALFVALGKGVCRKRAPKCSLCPLQEICMTGKKNASTSLTENPRPSSRRFYYTEKKNKSRRLAIYF